MLQQTTVATVGPRFERFIARWPDVAALAGAALDDVLHAWQGLGYYARARNLHACARQIMSQHDGRFPSTEAGLRELPGIGAYTAAAIAAIAFDQLATPVDGNIERVMRAALLPASVSAGRKRPELRRLAATLTPRARAGDYAQAEMDLRRHDLHAHRSPNACFALGATVAWRGRKASPKCFPLRLCPKPQRRCAGAWLSGWCGWTARRCYAARPATGLLGGMMEVPMTDWRTEPWSLSRRRARRRRSRRAGGFFPESCATALRILIWNWQILVGHVSTSSARAEASRQRSSRQASVHRLCRP